MSDIAGTNPEPDDDEEEEEGTSSTDLDSDESANQLGPQEEDHAGLQSRLNVDEGGENSSHLDDPAFAGVDTEYRNYAYDTSAPKVAEEGDNAKIEAEAKEREVLTAIQGESIGFRGYETATPHPSERENPADKYINANREILHKQASE